ncbi:MAG: CBS domain-containing protein, partial [Chloroflexi bacterium]|nr:CBS domain-containing protein [Chloroflexota bacterium]
IRHAAKLMLEHKIGGLPVMDQGKLVGIITESDIFRVLVQESEIDLRAEYFKIEQATGG